MDQDSAPAPAPEPRSDDDDDTTEGANVESVPKAGERRARAVELLKPGIRGDNGIDDEDDEDDERATS